MRTAARTSRKRLGRPAGSPRNREAILAAARQQFAERGYESATIRGIAAAAGVDPALVHHYFGTKDLLFAEAMELPISPSAVVPDVLAGDPGQLGERLVRRFLDLWSADSTGSGGALVGLAMTRFVIRIDPIVGTDQETLVACYAPPIQHLLTGSLSSDGGLLTKA